MDLLAIIRIAMRTLARNKMRSTLTMMGIIIGVASVIAMLGVGQGARQTMQEQIQAMGSNLLFVGAGTVTRSGMHMGWGSTKTLIYDDMLAIMRECPAAQSVAPGSSSSGQVVFGNDNWATRLNGTEPQYFAIRSWPFQEGSSFTQNDVEMSANVAVIGISHFAGSVYNAAHDGDFDAFEVFGAAFDSGGDGLQVEQGATAGWASDIIRLEGAAARGLEDVEC